MKTHWQALRIAFIIEASSHLVFFVHHSRTVTMVLTDWFAVLHLPTILLFRHCTLESHGYGLDFPLWGFWLITLQMIFWYALWYWLLVGLQTLKARRRRRQEQQHTGA